MRRQRTARLASHPKSDPINGFELVRCSDEEAAQFADCLFVMREDVREAFGEKYEEFIGPVMEGLRADLAIKGRSLLKEFVILSTPLMERNDLVSLWTLGAAVVELYYLRERMFPGIGKG